MFSQLLDFFKLAVCYWLYFSCRMFGSAGLYLSAKPSACTEPSESNTICSASAGTVVGGGMTFPENTAWFEARTAPLTKDAGASGR